MFSVLLFSFARNQFKFSADFFLSSHRRALPLVITVIASSMAGPLVSAIKVTMLPGPPASAGTYLAMLFPSVVYPDPQYPVPKVKTSPATGASLSHIASHGLHSQMRSDPLCPSILLCGEHLPLHQPPYSLTVPQYRLILFHSVAHSPATPK